MVPSGSVPCFASHRRATSAKVQLVALDHVSRYLPRMTLPEEVQATALREFADAVDALRQATARFERAAAEARLVNVSVNRMAEVSGMSRTKIYAVLKAAQSGADDATPAEPAKRSGGKRAAPKRDTGGPTIRARGTGY